MRKLEGLKPERVFYYFEEICKIPHGSGNTEAISKYLQDFALSLIHIWDRQKKLALFFLPCVPDWYQGWDISFMHFCPQCFLAE